MQLHLSGQRNELKAVFPVCQPALESGLLSNCVSCCFKLCAQAAPAAFNGSNWRPETSALTGHPATDFCFCFWFRIGFFLLLQRVLRRRWLNVIAADAPSRLIINHMPIWEYETSNMRKLLAASCSIHMPHSHHPHHLVADHFRRRVGFLYFAFILTLGQQRQLLAAVPPKTLLPSALIYEFLMSGHFTRIQVNKWSRVRGQYRK